MNGVDNLRWEITINWNGSIVAATNKQRSTNNVNLFLCKAYEEWWERSYKNLVVLAGKVSKVEKLYDIVDLFELYRT